VFETAAGRFYHPWPGELTLGQQHTEFFRYPPLSRPPRSFRARHLESGIGLGERGLDFSLRAYDPDLKILSPL